MARGGMNLIELEVGVLALGMCLASPPTLSLQSKHADQPASVDACCVCWGRIAVLLRALEDFSHPGLSSSEELLALLLCQIDVPQPPSGTLLCFSAFIANNHRMPLLSYFSTHKCTFLKSLDSS